MMKYNIGKSTLLESEEVSISGCSSELYEVRRTTGVKHRAGPFHNASEYTSTSNALKRFTKSRVDRILRGVLCAKANITRLMYTKAANPLARSFLLISKEHKNPLGMVWTHKDNLVMDDPFNQVPHWCLRPYELIDMKGLTQGGLFSTVPDARYNENKRLPERHTGYRDGRKKLMNKRFKHNDTNITSYSSGNTVGSFSMEPTIPGYDIDIPTLSEQHISESEWKPIFDRLDSYWTARDYFGGVHPYPPESLVADALEWIVNSRYDIGAVGGNWKCNSSHDTIRVLCAIAEQLGWDSATSKKHPYLVHDGTKIYFKWIPFVYESPLHKDHPVSAMVWSKSPIHWEEIL